MPALFSDPNLQIVRVGDFTPGIIRFSRGGYPSTYAPSARPGSASSSYRCWALPNVGLVPLPTYSLAQTNTAASASTTQMFTLGDMLPITGGGGPLGGDNVVAGWWIFNSIDGKYTITRGDADYRPSTVHTPTTIFTSGGAGAGLPVTMAWPVFDYGFFQNPGSAVGTGYHRVVLTVDLYNYNWITVGTWDSPTGTPPPYETGALPAPAQYTVRVFYHEYRAGLFHVMNTVPVDTLGFGGGASEGISVTSILNMGTWNYAGIFYPEITAGPTVAAWGSVSTGELFFVYGGGGAVIINGDMYAPTSVVKLPAVVGPGAVYGKAASTPAGLIYATETDGAYVWNGDNTSQKISANVPDDQLYRQPIPAYGIVRARSSNVAWGAQVMFPNNWMYDTVTGGWWQVEDPSIINFQVHSASNLGAKSFLSSPGNVVTPPFVTPALGIYSWDRLTPQTSYTWTSNPLPALQGALVSVQAVEIVASNPTPTASTITITPTVPTGQQPFQNQNNNQPATFTIPAHTVAYKAALRLGYTDYNIQVRVDASNNYPSNPAPTLHEFSVGYLPTRPSGI